MLLLLSFSLLSLPLLGVYEIQALLGRQGIQTKAYCDPVLKEVQIRNKVVLEGDNVKKDLPFTGRRKQRDGGLFSRKLGRKSEAA